MLRGSRQSQELNTHTQTHSCDRESDEKHMERAEWKRQYCIAILLCHWIEKDKKWIEKSNKIH